MQDIVTRGRWAIEKSAKVYIQAGAALIFGSHLPAKLRDLAQRLTTRPLIILGHFPDNIRSIAAHIPSPYAC